jgi:hypothetical protein
MSINELLTSSLQPIRPTGRTHGNRPYNSAQDGPYLETNMQNEDDGWEWPISKIAEGVAGYSEAITNSATNG